MKVKLKPGFLIREVAGEKVLLPSGQDRVDYSKMMVLNESAALIIEQMKGETFVSVDELVCLLLEQYNVKQDVLEADTYELIVDLERMNMLDIE